MPQRITQLPDALFRALIDALPESLVLLDAQGEILRVNASWNEFGYRNGLRISEASSSASPEQLSTFWIGVNYLQVCRNSALNGDVDAAASLAGILGVIRGEASGYYHEYPCHSPQERRWFMMRVAPLDWEGVRYCIISHHDITERKLAEERIEALALLDGLTGIPNRRYFDAFLAQEWKRAIRMQTPLALIMLDIDHFKEFNDLYGHPAGDECLRRIAQTLHGFAHRVGDIAARYGGEEFMLVLGNTTENTARQIAEKLRAAVEALDIHHASSRFAQHLTVSLGVSVAHPHREETQPTRLIAQADKALYAAKSAGRNQVMSVPSETGAPAASESD
ncbi:MAG: sensor domain-containing diguanylate cyclase [Pseudomonadota bacterium]